MNRRDFRLFASVILIIGSVWIAFVAYDLAYNRYHSWRFSLNGVGVFCQWQRASSGRWELVHAGVFSRRCAGTSTERSNNWWTGYNRLTNMSQKSIPRSAGEFPQRVVAVSIPTGLYVNGVKVPVSERERVFILDETGMAKSIDLTSEEMRQMQPGLNQDAFGRSKVWTEKILPLADPDKIYLRIRP